MTGYWRLLAAMLTLVAGGTSSATERTEAQNAAARSFEFEGAHFGLTVERLKTLFPMAMKSDNQRDEQVGFVNYTLPLQGVIRYFSFFFRRKGYIDSDPLC